MSLLDKIQDFKSAHPERVANVVDEGERICALPRATPREINMTPWMRPQCDITLWPLQRQALAAIQDHKGLLGAIGVGHGKTFVALLAGAVIGAKRTIVMAPPATVANLRHSLSVVARNFTVDPQSVVFLPYSRLSLQHGEEEMRALAKGVKGDDLVLVCDEAHLLKRPQSARTQRVLRFVTDYKPVFVALSGTMTSRKLSDFAHLAHMALDANSPLPRHGYPLGRQLLRAWGDVLDADGDRRWWHYTEVQRLRQWAGLPLDIGQPTPAEVDKTRQAFACRLRTCPGVVASREGAIGTSLHIEALADPRDRGKRVREIMRATRRTGQDPSGNELADPVAMWRCLSNLSLGFYYTWEWPDGRVDYEWLDARNDWHRHVRSEIERHGKSGYDSPLLVYNAIEREIAAGRSDAIHQAWREWVRVKDRPAPPVKTNWVDPDLLSDILASAKALGAGHPPIVFYNDRAVGESLTALIKTYRPGEAIDASKAHECAASIRSHGTGLNLQPWDTMVVLGMPSSGHIWEQLLGRLHRPGSPHDRISIYILAHTREFRRSFEAACRDGAYIEATTENRQKLMTASHGERLLKMNLKIKG